MTFVGLSHDKDHWRLKKQQLIPCDHRPADNPCLFSQLRKTKLGIVVDKATVCRG